MLFAIERLFVGVLYNAVEVIETAHIYGISTRVHSWPAESMDAAVIAEPVTRFVCTELVKGKILPTFYQCEVFVLDGVMQNTFLQHIEQSQTDTWSILASTSNTTVPQWQLPL